MCLKRQWFTFKAAVAGKDFIMLVNTLKTLLVAGLIVVAVGLTGCDRHGHHRRHYISPSRGHDVHYGGGRFSSYDYDSYGGGGGGYYESDRSRSYGGGSFNRSTKSPPKVYTKNRNSNKSIAVVPDNKFKSKHVRPHKSHGGKKHGKGFKTFKRRK